MQLRERDNAPLFSALSDSGERVSLSDQIGKNNIVLYFYPKDFTSGCTKESCVFRDNLEKINSFGATVFGISSDSVESHSEFKKKYTLPYTLLSDENHEIRKMYGIDGRFLPPRVTFVIDKQGKIRSIYNSQLNISKHIENALKILADISGEFPASIEKRGDLI
ncbi:MAG: peroxiredoxin [Nitrososphaerales archaeon]